MGVNWKQILSVGVNIGSAVASSLTGMSIFSMVPSLVMAVENAFQKNKSTAPQGDTKKAIVLETALSMISLTEGITRKDLVDNEKFMNALDKLIDDVVELENAIHWKTPASIVTNS